MNKDIVTKTSEDTKTTNSIKYVNNITKPIQIIKSHISVIKYTK